MILASMSDVLSRRQTCWHTGGRTDVSTHRRRQRQYPEAKLALDRNKILNERPYFHLMKWITRQLHQPRLWFITGGYLVKRWFIPAAARARGQSNDLNREILASNLSQMSLRSYHSSPNCLWEAIIPIAPGKKRNSSRPRGRIVR